ncbi:uncharacterized protein C8A04DRAFT_10405 [Dichotomopilus funicola]|uniref:Uncharacterized protein n=1 Tax=Dichotomopilus funicola TaxID=1934379 RepID=A0AAN6ZNG0_9PEZI|nr:hypothetical protein C8A04DRAFT_10405 [Dichotomopilus funicola]
MATTSRSDNGASLGPALPTPTHGSGGTFSVSCTALIEATPEECLNVIVNSLDCMSPIILNKDPAWNRFCRTCTIDSQPADTDTHTQPRSQLTTTTLRLGTQFTFAVYLPPDKPDSGPPDQHVAPETNSNRHDITTDNVTTSPRKGLRIAWKVRPSWLRPGWALRSERVQDLIETVGPDGKPATEYRCWETFYGTLAPVVKMAVGSHLERGFDAWLRGLKERAEGRM